MSDDRWEPEKLPQLHIILDDRDSVSTNDLARIMTAISDLSRTASMLAHLADPDWYDTAPEPARTHLRPGASPRVVYVRNESPVTILLQGVDLPAALGFLGWLLLHPADLRTFFIRYQTDVDKAKVERLKAEQALKNLSGESISVPELEGATEP